jgi:hypothetical protein
VWRVLRQALATGELAGGCIESLEDFEIEITIVGIGHMSCFLVGGLAQFFIFPSTGNNTPN